MTKREMFMAIKEVVKDNAEMVNFLNHELELLDRKNSTPKKPTATQVENSNYKELIVNYLSTQSEGQCIKDIQSNISELTELTNQRITHLLTDLVKTATLKKEYVKKTPYYSIA